MRGTVGVGLVATSKSLSPALVGQWRYTQEVADLSSRLSSNASFTDKLCPCIRFWTFSYIESKNCLLLFTLSNCIFNKVFSTWFSNCFFWLLVTLYIVCLTFGDSLREFLLCQSADILSHLRLSSYDLRSHPVDCLSLNSATSLEARGGYAVSPFPAALQRKNVNYPFGRQLTILRLLPSRAGSWCWRCTLRAGLLTHSLASERLCVWCF